MVIELIVSFHSVPQSISSRRETWWVGERLPPKNFIHHCILGPLPLTLRFSRLHTHSTLWTWHQFAIFEIRLVKTKKLDVTRQESEDKARKKVWEGSSKSRKHTLCLDCISREETNFRPQIEGSKSTREFISSKISKNIIMTALESQLRDMFGEFVTTDKERWFISQKIPLFCISAFSCEFLPLCEVQCIWLLLLLTLALLDFFCVQF